MAKKLKKSLSLLLALCMVMSLLNVPAFAAEADDDVQGEGVEAAETLIDAAEEAGDSEEGEAAGVSGEAGEAVMSEEGAVADAAVQAVDPTLSPVLKMTVTPAADYSNVKVGDTIKWAVTITNNSNSACTSTWVEPLLIDEDNSFSNFDEVKAYYANGEAVYMSGNYIWAGDLSGEGSSCSFTVEIKIPESAAGKTITAVARPCYYNSNGQFAQGGYNPNAFTPMQVAAPVQYDPELSPVLKVKVTPDEDYSNVEVGQTIKWAVTITNKSDSSCEYTYVAVPYYVESSMANHFAFDNLIAYDENGKALPIEGYWVNIGDLSGANNTYSFTVEGKIPESVAGKSITGVAYGGYWRNDDNGELQFWNCGWTSEGTVGPMQVTAPVQGVARIEQTGEVYETLQAALDATKADQRAGGTEATITLLSDTTETVKASYTGGTTYYLTLDLNGHTITGKGDGPVITYWPGSTKGSYKFSLTINDSVGTGTITGGNATYGGAIYVRSGGSGVTVTINGGNFTGNTATYGGVVSFFYQDGGTLNVNGGTFADNTAASNGGAIYARSVIVKGGTFNNNTADKGGAIYVVGTGMTADLAISNAKVYNNKAAAYGDDIVFGLTGNYTRATTLALMDASSMNIEGVNAWLVDGYNLTEECDRASDEYCEAFTAAQWPNTSKTGKAIIALKAGAVHVHTAGTPVKENEVPATYDANGSYDEVIYCTECGKEISRETKTIPQLVAVASIGETKYGTLAEAVNAAVSGDTVVLLTETTENVKIQTKTITLDLNGNTLNANGNAIQISGSSSKTGLTITGNGTINATGIGVNMGGGTLTVENGTISAMKGIVASVSSSTYAVTINVNGGTIEGTSYGIEAVKYTTVNINGGAVKGTGSTGEGVRVSGQSNVGGQLNVTGGTITGQLYGITLTAKGTKATVSGGTVVALNPAGSTDGISVKSGAALVVTGGTIVGPVKGYGVYNSGSTIEISGGTISGANAVFQAASGKTTITDGYFTGNIYGKTTQVPISGGHFTVDVSDYVVDGLSCVECKCEDVEGYAYEVKEVIYTVTFKVSNSMFGTVNGNATVTVKSGECVGENLPTATGKTGYTFLGWKMEDGTPFTAETPVTGDITVTARWQVTLTFHDDKNGNFTMDAEVGTQVAAPSANDVEGWKFLGWATGTSITYDKVKYEVGAPINVVNAKAVNFYARWELVPTTPTFTAGTQIQLKVYDENGASWGPYGFWDDVNYDFYSVGEVIVNDGTNSKAPVKDYPYQCTLTLDVARMLLGYSNNHELTSEKTAQVTMYCRASDGRWATWTDGVGNFSYVVQYTAYVHHTAADAVKENEVEATCTASGSYELVEYCSVCDKEMSREAVTVEATGHTWDEGVVTDTTCTTEGNILHTCTVCGATVEEIISPVGHTVVVDAAVAPTCTETGLTEGAHCEVCGAVVIAQTLISPVGHTIVIDAAVAPTCTETGLTEGAHCEVCNTVVVEQETVPAAGHRAVTIPGVAATCTEAGLTDGSRCAICGTLLIAQVTIPATGHQNVVADAAVEPTETSTGLTEGSHCADCGAIIVAQQVVDALGTEDPGTEIGDDEPPMSEQPGTEIGDDEPPMSEQPGDEDLNDPDVPMADAPQTGDNMIVWVAMAGLSAAALAGVIFTGKRKEDEEA